MPSWRDDRQSGAAEITREQSRFSKRVRLSLCPGATALALPPLRLLLVRGRTERAE
jgi:hypothetical protein